LTGDRHIFDAALVFSTVFSTGENSFINLPQDASALKIRFDHLNEQSASGDNR